MRRGGLRLEPDRRSRSTWLGLLTGSWVFLALLAWLDPFGWGRRDPPPLPPPELILITPKPGLALPRDVGLVGDGFGARFAVGAIGDAPRRYGTTDQLMRTSFAGAGGPQSLTEALSLPGQAFIAEVGPALRVVPILSGNYPNWAPESRTFDLPEPADTAWRGPQEGRVVLERGCLRLGPAGPLAILGPRANAVFVDDAGWLVVGNLVGTESLRIGETGMVATAPLPDEPGVTGPLQALRTQCGGNPEAVVIERVFRTPVCDLTPAQVAENRAAMNANQRAISDRMAEVMRERLSPCLASGKSEAQCRREIPPMPPPPMDFSALPHQGLAPGDQCLPQSKVPAGAWRPDQPR